MDKFKEWNKKKSSGTLHIPSPMDMDEAATDWCNSGEGYFSPSENEEGPIKNEEHDGKCGEESQTTFNDFLRNWAIEFNIAQVALKPLIERLKAVSCKFAHRPPHSNAYVSMPHLP